MASDIGIGILLCDYLHFSSFKSFYCFAENQPSTPPSSLSSFARWGFSGRGLLRTSSTLAMFAAQILGFAVLDAENP